MDENKVRLSPLDFIPLMQERFDAGLPLKLTVTGNSMLPFLADKRDSVILTKVHNEPKKGDIYLFQRADGRCVLHRVRCVAEDGIFFIGDAQSQIEGPISPDCLLAECHEAIRKGKTITTKSLVWRFFSVVWIRIIRGRPLIGRIIGKFKHHKQKIQ